MSEPLSPIVRMRLCARDGCGVSFPTPHGGTWPAAFCSLSCWRTAKTAPSRLKRSQLRAAPSTTRARPVSVASREQRAAVAEQRCIVCGASPTDPAHLLPRSLADDGDGDPRAVVPLCREHHRAYDEGGLSLLAHLEPHYREAIAFAVSRVGLVATLRRVTNDRRAAA